jgi:hypothetical protein
MNSPGQDLQITRFSIEGEVAEMRPLRNLLRGHRALEARAAAAEAEASSLRAALHAVASAGTDNIPPVLYAAATTPARDGQAVKLEVSGSDVTAVVGDEGCSPPEWRAAISRGVAGRLAS